MDTILITGHSTVESAVSALKKGAFDYIMKPFDPDELVATVNRVFAYRELAFENELLRRDLAGDDPNYNSPIVVGTSEIMRQTMEIVHAVAPMPTGVLLRGESGTGKELVADEIHRLSKRSDGPLVKVNCAALPENLLEDELFGHEKGAFTGAMGKRIGRFEEADGGTIFLDEIGEMNPLLQAKLLRVLQQRTFQRVGSNEEIQVDVRIICATNKDLESAVAEGTFREDLYYRINVVQIVLPTLRERNEDIPELVEILSRRIARKLGIPSKNFTVEAVRRLQAMEFPGNIRELQNLIERILIFSTAPMVDVNDVQCGIDGFPQTPLETNSNELATSGVSIGNMSTLYEIEREAIRATLEATNGNMYQAAKRLDISRSTLYSKVKKLNLDRNEK